MYFFPQHSGNGVLIHPVPYGRLSNWFISPLSSWTPEVLKGHLLPASVSRFFPEEKLGVHLPTCRMNIATVLLCLLSLGNGVAPSTRTQQRKPSGREVLHEPVLLT